MSLTAEQQTLADQITNLNRLTVLGIIEGKSQRQAYYDAGGKAKSDKAADSVVSEMLSNPKVKAFYDSLLEQASNNAIMTRQQALERLSVIASTEITDILEFETVQVEVADKDGGTTYKDSTIWRMKESDELKRRAGMAIKSVKMTKNGPEIAMYDVTDAIRTLSKLNGWDAAQKLDLSSTDGSMKPTPAIVISEEAAKSLASKLVD